MSTATETDQLWSEEPSQLKGHARIRARIAGLHCSLCTGTIEKALGRHPGVDKVAVSDLTFPQQEGRCWCRRCAPGARPATGRSRR